MLFATSVFLGLWGGCFFQSRVAVRISDTPGPSSDKPTDALSREMFQGVVDDFTDNSRTAVNQLRSYVSEGLEKNDEPSIEFQEALNSKMLPPQFPTWAQMALRRGVFNSAMIIGTKFLRNASNGKTVAKLRLPKESTGNNTVEFDVKLLFTKADALGSPLVGVYESDLRYEGKLLYIAATPAGSWNDRIQIARNLANLTSTKWGNQDIKISNMVEEKLDTIWDGRDGLGNALFGQNGLVERFPHHRFLFFGQSQGGALAQALALRYECERQVRGGPSPAYVLSFGGFRWTDARGKELAQALIQDRQVNFVMAELVNGREAYDDIPGMPKSRTGFENMPNMFSLHRDHGVIRYCDGTCPADIKYLTVLQRLQPLHFAGPVLKGLKLAIKFYGPSDVATCQDLCNVGAMQSGCKPVLETSGSYCKIA